MHRLHGLMGQSGQSLDGIVYRQGDPVTIIDDGLVDGSQDIVRVLLLHSGQSLAVPLSSVCWISTPESSPRQWTNTSLAGDAPELDGFSENSLSTGLSSPSVASPLTPSASVCQPEVSRHDSAIDLCYNDNVVGQQVVEAAKGSNTPHFIQSAATSPFCPSPAAASSHAHGGVCAPNSMEQDRLADKSLPSGNIHTGFLGMLGNEYPQWSPYQHGAAKVSAMINPDSSNYLQVNYMYTPPTQDQQPREAPRQAGSSPVAQTPLPWAAQPVTTSGYDWQPYTAQGYPAAAPVTQAPQPEVPQFHGPAPITTDPGHNYQTMAGLVSPFQSYSMSGMQNGHVQGSAPHGAVPQDVQPTFYRAQEQHTMNLTEPPNHPSAPPRATNSRASRSHGSRSRRSLPEPELKEGQALRFDIVLEHFRRQVGPDVDLLEAREREEKENPTDQARAKLVSEALELIRPAVTEITSVLEPLPPVTSQPFAESQSRLQRDADRIIGVIHVIRKSALEGTEIRQHENQSKDSENTKAPDDLPVLVKKYVKQAAYLGKVSGFVARNQKPAASSTANAETDRSAPEVTVARPTAAAAGLSSYNWVQGQTTPPPEHHAGMALGLGQHPMLQALPAAPPASAFANQPTFAGFDLTGRPMHPASSGVSNTAMGAIMPSINGPGPVMTEGWMSHANAHPAVQPSPAPSFGYPMANMYTSPPQAAYGAASGQLHTTHTMHSPVGASQFSGPAHSTHSSNMTNMQMVLPAHPHTHPLGMSGRRGSLPDRRLMARERERAAPYPRTSRALNERKGSV